MNIVGPLCNRASADHFRATGLQPTLIDDSDFCFESSDQMPGIHLEILPTKPQLRFIAQPSEKYRFRYFSERGAGHGPLKSDSKSTRFPSVELKNIYLSGPVEINVQFYTWDSDENKRVPHRILQFQEGDVLKTSITYPCVKRDGSLYAELKGLRIMKLTKSDLQMRLKMTCEEAEDTWNRFHYLPGCLRIEATHQNINIAEPIYSNKIRGFRESTSNLRIHRLSTTLLRTGGELWLLTDQVKKNDIEVLLRSEATKSVSACKIDAVHHQYTIVCSIPEIGNRDRKMPLQMKLFLRRPSDDTTSSPFEVTLREDYPPAKRKRESSDRLLNWDNYNGLNNKLTESEMINLDQSSVVAGEAASLQAIQENFHSARTASPQVAQQAPVPSNVCNNVLPLNNQSSSGNVPWLQSSAIPTMTCNVQTPNINTGLQQWQLQQQHPQLLHKQQLQQQVYNQQQICPPLPNQHQPMQHPFVKGLYPQNPADLHHSPDTNQQQFCHLSPETIPQPLSNYSSFSAQSEEGTASFSTPPSLYTEEPIANNHVTNMDTSQLTHDGGSSYTDILEMLRLHGYEFDSHKNNDNSGGEFQSQYVTHANIGKQALRRTAGRCSPALALAKYEHDTRSEKVSEWDENSEDDYACDSDDKENDEYDVPGTSPSTVVKDEEVDNQTDEETLNDKTSDADKATKVEVDEPQSPSEDLELTNLINNMGHITINTKNEHCTCSTRREGLQEEVLQYIRHVGMKSESTEVKQQLLPLFSTGNRVVQESKQCDVNNTSKRGKSELRRESSLDSGKQENLEQFPVNHDTDNEIPNTSSLKTTELYENVSPEVERKEGYCVSSKGNTKLSDGSTIKNNSSKNGESIEQNSLNFGNAIDNYDKISKDSNNDNECFPGSKKAQEILDTQNTTRYAEHNLPNLIHKLDRPTQVDYKGDNPEDFIADSANEMTSPMDCERTIEYSLLNNEYEDFTPSVKKGIHKGQPSQRSLEKVKGTFTENRKMEEEEAAAEGKDDRDMEEREGESEEDREENEEGEKAEDKEQNNQEKGGEKEEGERKKEEEEKEDEEEGEKEDGEEEEGDEDEGEKEGEEEKEDEVEEEEKDDDEKQEEGEDEEEEGEVDDDVISKTEKTNEGTATGAKKIPNEKRTNKGRQRTPRSTKQESLDDKELVAMKEHCLLRKERELMAKQQELYEMENQLKKRERELKEKEKQLLEMQNSEEAKANHGLEKHITHQSLGSKEMQGSNAQKKRFTKNTTTNDTKEEDFANKDKGTDIRIPVISQDGNTTEEEFREDEINGNKLYCAVNIHKNKEGEAGIGGGEVDTKARNEINYRVEETEVIEEPRGGSKTLNEEDGSKKKENGRNTGTCVNITKKEKDAETKDIPPREYILDVDGKIFNENEIMKEGQFSVKKEAIQASAYDKEELEDREERKIQTEKQSYMEKEKAINIVHLDNADWKKENAITDMKAKDTVRECKSQGLGKTCNREPNTIKKNETNTRHRDLNNQNEDTIREENVLNSEILDEKDRETIFYIIEVIEEHITRKDATGDEESLDKSNEGNAVQKKQESPRDVKVKINAEYKDITTGHQEVSFMNQEDSVDGQDEKITGKEDVSTVDPKVSSTGQEEEKFDGHINALSTEYEKEAIVRQAIETNAIQAATAGQKKAIPIGENFIGKERVAPVILDKEAIDRYEYISTGEQEDVDKKEEDTINVHEKEATCGQKEKVIDGQKDIPAGKGEVITRLKEEADDGDEENTPVEQKVEATIECDKKTTGKKIKITTGQEGKMITEREEAPPTIEEATVVGKLKVTDEKQDDPSIEQESVCGLVGVPVRLEKQTISKKKTQAYDRLEEENIAEKDGDSITEHEVKSSNGSEEANTSQDEVVSGQEETIEGHRQEITKELEEECAKQVELVTATGRMVDSVTEQEEEPLTEKVEKASPEQDETLTVRQISEASEGQGYEIFVRQEIEAIAEQRNHGFSGHKEQTTEWEKIEVIGAKKDAVAVQKDETIHQKEETGSGDEQETIPGEEEETEEQKEVITVQEEETYVEHEVQAIVGQEGGIIGQEHTSGVEEGPPIEQEEVIIGQEEETSVNDEEKSIAREETIAGKKEKNARDYEATKRHEETNPGDEEVLGEEKETNAIDDEEATEQYEDETNPADKEAEIEREEKETNAGDDREATEGHEENKNGDEEESIGQKEETNTRDDEETTERHKEETNSGDEEKVREEEIETNAGNNKGVIERHDEENNPEDDEEAREREETDTNAGDEEETIEGEEKETNAGDNEEENNPGDEKETREGEEAETNAGDDEEATERFEKETNSRDEVKAIEGEERDTNVGYEEKITIQKELIIGKKGDKNDGEEQTIYGQENTITNAWKREESLTGRKENISTEEEETSTTVQKENAVFGNEVGSIAEQDEERINGQKGELGTKHHEEVSVRQEVTVGLKQDTINEKISTTNQERMKNYSQKKSIKSEVVLERETSVADQLTNDEISSLNDELEEAIYKDMERKEIYSAMEQNDTEYETANEMISNFNSPMIKCRLCSKCNTSLKRKERNAYRSNVELQEKHRNKNIHLTKRANWRDKKFRHKVRNVTDAVDCESADDKITSDGKSRSSTEEETSEEQTGSSTEKETSYRKNKSSTGEETSEEQTGSSNDEETSNGESGSSTEEETSEGQTGSGTEEEASEVQSGSSTEEETSDGESGSSTEEEASEVQSGSSTEEETSEGQTGSGTEEEASEVQSGSSTEEETSDGESGSSTEEEASEVQSGSSTEEETSEGQTGSGTEEEASEVQSGSSTEEETSDGESGNTSEEETEDVIRERIGEKETGNEVCTAREMDTGEESNMKKHNFVDDSEDDDNEAEDSEDHEMERENRETDYSKNTNKNSERKREKYEYRKYRTARERRQSSNKHGYSTEEDSTDSMNRRPRKTAESTTLGAKMKHDPERKPTKSRRRSLQSREVETAEGNPSSNDHKGEEIGSQGRGKMGGNREVLQVRNRKTTCNKEEGMGKKYLKDERIKTEQKSSSGNIKRDVKNERCRTGKNDNERPHVNIEDGSVRKKWNKKQCDQSQKQTELDQYTNVKDETAKGERATKKRHKDNKGNAKKGRDYDNCEQEDSDARWSCIVS
ncbi:trichohyalin-like isoform X2 [Palaemon carinicauda]|uniref:trichohyalin-like isoform X2 n=1 Tax=Palaemon carinicauda TaxID=392227 RepID=UPI0035B64173